MQYGKLTNDKLIYAPHPLLIEMELTKEDGTIVTQDMQVFNPTIAQYLSKGYKPIEKTTVPETPPFHAASCVYTETEDKITESFRLVYDAAAEIEYLKRQLSATDYQAIKHSEGWISDEDYAPVKVQRQTWRDRINDIEGTAD